MVKNKSDSFFVFVQIGSDSFLSKNKSNILCINKQSEITFKIKDNYFKFVA